MISSIFIHERQTNSHFISHRWFSHGTQTPKTSNAETLQPIQFSYAWMLKLIPYLWRNMAADPIIMPQCHNWYNTYIKTWQLIHVSYAGIWQPIHSTHHNHKYIFNIKHLSRDFMAIIVHQSHLQQVWSTMQYSYTHIHLPYIALVHPRV